MYVYKILSHHYGEYEDSRLLLRDTVKFWLVGAKLRGVTCHVLEVSSVPLSPFVFLHDMP